MKRWLWTTAVVLAVLGAGGAFADTGEDSELVDAYFEAATPPDAADAMAQLFGYSNWADLVASNGPVTIDIDVAVPASWPYGP